MQIYDVIHGYQPFTTDLISPWVSTNLDNTFLPTSRAMGQGLIRRNVQLQGWTIDAWLNSPMSQTAKRVLKNLKKAYGDGYIEIGSSAYSHPILPLLSDMLAYAEIKADFMTVTENLAEPSFFWFPECAMNQKILEILHIKFPKLIPVIPDRCIDANKSMFAKIVYSDKSEGRAFICNVLLKDVLMNAIVYKRPDYVPQKVDWSKAKVSMRNGKYFTEVVDLIDPTDRHILVRDWENGESRDALIQIGNKKEVKAFMEVKDSVEFKLFRENEDFDIQIKIEDIKPACWEPVSTKEDPFPYWTPVTVTEAKKEIVNCWLGILGLYDNIFQEIILCKTSAEPGCLNKNLDLVDEAFRDVKFLEIFKQTSPALLSCLPWHILAREEWERFPEFPVQLIEFLVRPLITQLIEYHCEVTGRESDSVVILKNITEKLLSSYRPL